MDFTHFSNVLQKLLIKNKNVTIPRIGCFVLEELNSEIQFSGKIITPPKTTLLFCTSEVDNDGELEKYLAEQNNITIAQAKIMLEDVVNDIVSALEVKGATILDGLGEISKGQNGELYFHPFNDDKSFMPNLPFEPVSIKPILKRDNNAIVDNIEIELEDDLPVASVPLEPIDVVKEDDANQELSFVAIS